MRIVKEVLMSEQAAVKTTTGSPSDAELESLRRERFQARVQRVLAVMQEERVDWRGVPFVAADGRIGVRVMPVEMRET